MKFRVITTRLEIRGSGTFRRGEIIELPPDVSVSIRPGLIEPVTPKKQTSKEEGK